MGVEIGAPHLFHERGIVFGEAPFDLFEDALFVVA